MCSLLHRAKFISFANLTICSSIVCWWISQNRTNNLILEDANQYLAHCLPSFSPNVDMLRQFAKVCLCFMCSHCILIFSMRYYIMGFYLGYVFIFSYVYFLSVLHSVAWSRQNCEGFLRFTGGLWFGRSQANRRSRRRPWMRRLDGVLRSSCSNLNRLFSPKRNIQSRIVAWIAGDLTWSPDVKSILRACPGLSGNVGFFCVRRHCGGKFAEFGINQ